MITYPIQKADRIRNLSIKSLLLSLYMRLEAKYTQRRALVGLIMQDIAASEREATTYFL